MIVCLPPGIFLSLLMVPMIRMLKDHANAGTSAGQIFAMGTFGSLIGNFVAGFYLIAWFGTATILAWTALGIALLSLMNLVLLVCFSGNRTSDTTERDDVTEKPAAVETGREVTPTVDWRIAVVTVFLCSFVSGSLEGAAFRILAPVAGVSLLLTAGVVGVVPTPASAGFISG